MRILALLTAFILVVAISFSGLLHSLVPHEHGHGQGEELVWGSLHSSLSHEQKAAVFIPELLLMLGFIAFFIFHTGALVRPRVVKEEIRRGVEKYRRFR